MNKLKNKLDQIPALPGIYKMLDSTGRIIYVGKSKCLKKRVHSYFTKAPKQAKIEKMIFFIADIDYTVTDTHLEACLLECQLIKEIKPYFNTQMKNDRKYFYLKINNADRSQLLSIVLEREVDTFGPFRDKQLIQSLMAALTHLYPLVSNDNSYDFAYHPLPVTLHRADFMATQKSLQQIFSDDLKLQNFINQLQQCMAGESAQFNYERATTYRDLIKSLTYITHLLHDFKRLITSELVLKIPVGDGEKLFFISKGKIVLKKHFPILTQPELAAFLDAGSRLTASRTTAWDEKTAMDFQTILFSEIQSLPDEWILKQINFPECLGHNEKRLQF
ncbi:hypothetical protein GH810_03615 [Acetobacterium paludosum]|uniref:GIY-YIG domain-containing protein n=1 Tax=Acetobacterium paludosum TaxID=52693 RepID=A0A923HWT2_9FIRM|nr:GIY-YIG nuclease family protein [Acetobacterium paludosum]MBC3887396.1 hypothetical protein [Acetobacterium paludosum]